MARAPVGAALRQVERIFGGEGTVSGLTEAQLLDRFAASGDDAAFEAIVRSHGNSVMAVCRRLLGDPHEAEDAFQATFLVLARRAGSIGRSRPIGPWLVGVAYRIARKARVASARRRRREGVAAGRRPESTDAPDPITIDLGPVLWEELHRLPGKYRDPVILCWVEGHSYDEAADRLRWPVGTVKGRLHRAKETLQKRLTHRGITAPVAGLSAWFASEASAAVVPPPVIGSTVTSAVAVTTGAAFLAGTVPAGSYLLARGALRTMILAKLSISAAALTFVTGTLAGGYSLVAVSQGQDITARTKPASTALTTTKTPANPRTFTDAPGASLGQDVKPEGGLEAANSSASTSEPSSFYESYTPDPFAEPTVLDSLKADRVSAALQRLQAQMAFFKAGTINIDRVLAAARALLDARLDVEQTPKWRRTSLEQYRDFLVMLRDGEQAKTRQGTGSDADLAEVAEALSEAEVLFAAGSPPQSGDPSTPGTGTTAPSGTSNVAEGNPFEGSGRMPLAGSDLIPSLGEPGMGGRADRPGSDPASQKVIARLEQPIAMPFENDTPLDDVLDYIRQATADENHRQGIPIYVDEFGLQQAEQSLQSPVKITLEGIPLRTTLWLALKQLDLAYTVIDGVLIISEPGQLKDFLSEKPIYSPPDTPSGPNFGTINGFGMGMGGGMGGVVGGSAGGFGMGGGRIGTGTSGFGAVGGMGGGVGTTSRPQPNLNPFDQ
ncbi:RNA polymerase sigma factor [Tautonia plasticadhaerens]|uniref:ECF RNA polymerase sigma factor SigW n=1 Tax=Tautonia plasticadhaerens TaxID=2527974 RepID=A0A518H7K1_9BACT|nr:RNA polymerase sigma factor [Tautonia plasticadhaerens]QDV36795.1 ECF RNA polymerase sigma factor SigW [Tautonia plasticadhaerens]